MSVIGIDLGTCYTKVGVFNSENFQIIENSSERQTLNYVAIKPNGREIGENLRAKIRMNFKKTILDSKVFIGSTYNETNRYHARFPFKIQMQDEKLKLQIESGEEFSPEEITAIVLRKLKTTAEKHLSKEVTGAVLSVPNSFTDSQRQATIDAVNLAGIRSFHLINDSTAAAVAYAYDKNLEGIKNILIYDLGGYFLNLSIVRIRNGVVDVISSGSYPELGGQIFDFRMVEYLGDKIEKKFGKNVLTNKKIVQTLIAECEKTKRNLSNGLESHIEVSSLFDEDEDFSFKFSREKFENLNEDLFEKTIACVNNIVQNSGLNKTQIDEVVIIGGSSRIPRIQKLLSHYFVGKKINLTMNASETVVYGAAIQAAFLTGQKLKRNNGFKYLDKVNREYTLKLFNHKNEELIDLFIKPYQTLPSNQCVILNKSLIEIWRKLVLNENGIEISSLQIPSFHELKHIEVSLNIDKCGLVIVDVRTPNKYGYIETIYTNSNEKKLYCLSSNEKQKLANDNIKYEKLIIKENEKLVFKNSLEEKCYMLKKEISKANTGIYADFEKEIESCLDNLRTSDCDLVKIEELGVELEKMHKKYEIASVLIEKCFKFKKEIESANAEIRKYCSLEMEIDKILSSLNSFNSIDLNKIEEFIKKKQIEFEKLNKIYKLESMETNFLELKEEISKINANSGRYAIFENEIDQIIKKFKASTGNIDLAQEEILLRQKQTEFKGILKRHNLEKKTEEELHAFANSLYEDQKKEDQLNNNSKNIVSDSRIFYMKAIETGIFKILEEKEKFKVLKTCFDILNDNIKEILDESKTFDQSILKSKINLYVKIICDFETLKEKINHDWNILVNIQRSIDKMYSKNKFIKLEFAEEITRLCKKRENMEISKEIFCEKLKKYIKFNLNQNLTIDGQRRIEELNESLKKSEESLVLD